MSEKKRETHYQVARAARLQAGRIGEGILSGLKSSVQAAAGACSYLKAIRREDQNTSGNWIVDC